MPFEHVYWKEYKDELQIKLITLPRWFKKWEGVQYSLGMLRALFTNDHVRFFEIFKHSPFHPATCDMSRNIMEAFVDGVRQRAIRQWAPWNPDLKTKVYTDPSHRKFSLVLKELNWTVESGESQKEIDVGSAFKQVLQRGMSVKFDEQGDLSPYKAENIPFASPSPFGPPLFASEGFVSSRAAPGRGRFKLFRR